MNFCKSVMHMYLGVTVMDFNSIYVASPQWPLVTE